MWRLIFRNFAFPSLILRIVCPLILFFNPVGAIVTNTLLDWVDGQCWYQKKITWLQYNIFDKSLDYWWYVIILIYAFFNLPYFPLLFALFLFRGIGQILFYIKKDDKYFLYFPNIFETVFILLILFGRSFNIYIILIISTLFKLLNEYFVHIYLYEGDNYEKQQEIFKAPVRQR